MPTLDFVGTTNRLRGIAVVQLNEQLWRVTLPAGDVLGYIEQFSADHSGADHTGANHTGADHNSADHSSGGVRYRAKRFLARQRRFIMDGEFWAMDDAIDCFRTS